MVIKIGVLELQGGFSLHHDIFHKVGIESIPVRLNSDLDNSKISIIGISNDAKFTSWLDPRVKSRLGEESLTFSPYNAPQIEDILVQRARMAFKENTVDPMVMTYCASKAAQEHGDARKAIDLLRIAAELAEREEREIVTHAPK